MAPHANGEDGHATGISVEPARAPAVTRFSVDAPNVKYTDDAVTAQYTYRTTDVSLVDGKYQAKPKESIYDFETKTTVGKVGLML
ncbi:Myo-inositol-1-phosphate synthase, partial [Teratosphaeriaceae sp. CCFEE 6253]